MIGRLLAKRRRVADAIARGVCPDCGAPVERRSEAENASLGRLAIYCDRCERKRDPANFYW